MPHFINVAIRVSFLVSIIITCTAPALCQKSETTIAPGVTWYQETVTSAPWRINVITAELKRPNITVETEPGQNRLFAGEQVTDSVRRESNPETSRVIAGLNGDFWTMTPKPYIPIGLMVSDGLIYNKPAANRSAFALTADERVFFGLLSMEISATAGNQQMSVSRINSSRVSEETVLFNSAYGEIPPGGAVRYLLQPEKPEFLPNQPLNTLATKCDSATSLTLKGTQMLLSLPESATGAFHNIDKQTVILKASIPEISGMVTYAVGGGPRLLRDGTLSVEYSAEKMGEKFASERHPRSAIGVTRDGQTLVMLTVDGRQPGYSVGQNLYELGDTMRQYGCWNAINMDGGGSTTMVVHDKVVNRPSDAMGPRSVCNSVLLIELNEKYENKPPGGLTTNAR